MIAAARLRMSETVVCAGALLILNVDLAQADRSCCVMSGQAAAFSIGALFSLIFSQPPMLREYSSLSRLERPVAQADRLMAGTEGFAMAGA
jgi:hypothetical protein